MKLQFTGCCSHRSGGTAAQWGFCYLLTPCQKGVRGTIAAQVTAGLAAWVARTKAASVKIHVRPHGDYREDFGPRIALATSLLTVDGRYSDQVATKWADPGELAYALVAPCLRWGLRCCLEQGSDGDAIVMRRMP